MRTFKTTYAARAGRLPLLEIGSTGIAAANATPKYESRMRNESVANIALCGWGWVVLEGRGRMDKRRDNDRRDWWGQSCWQTCAPSPTSF